MGRIQHRVSDHSFFFPDVDLRLNLGHFFLELAQNVGGVDGMDENGNVKNFIQIDNGRKPAHGKVARVGDDKKSAADFFAQPDVIGRHFQSRGRDNVFQFQSAGLVYLLRKNRQNFFCFSCFVFFFPPAGGFEKIQNRHIVLAISH